MKWWKMENKRLTPDDWEELEGQTFLLTITGVGGTDEDPLVYLQFRNGPLKDYQIKCNGAVGKGVDPEPPCFDKEVKELEELGERITVINEMIYGEEEEIADGEEYDPWEEYVSGR